jgi:Membrane GTPase LepA
VRVKNGVLKAGMKVRMMSTGAAHEVDQVGVFTPKHENLPALAPARSAS